MVESISLNTIGPTRPGVFVGQTSYGTGLQPISNHAVGYIFGTTEEDYDSRTFSSLIPYKPTQITSIDDFVRKAGGVPTDQGSRITYDSINAFFQNVGNNGILYFTRVTPTPEVVLDVSSAGFGYDYFALKINGKYIGDTPLGISDSNGDPIFVIKTTGIDSKDNALDLFRSLEDDSDFRFVYGAEQSAENVDNSELRIFSKDPTILLNVDNFVAYKSSEEDPTVGSKTLLHYNRSYYPAKDIVIRLKSRDDVSGKEIVYVDGDSLAPVEEPADASAFTALLGGYIKTQLGISNLSAGQVIAVSADTAGYLASYVGYTTVTTGGDPETEAVYTPAGNVPTGNVETRIGYLPDSVQIVYLEVAGENRVFIINGKNVTELANDLVSLINEVLVEKGLDKYYEVTNATSVSDSQTVYLPNNGYDLTAAADHGDPSIKPELSGSSPTATNLKLEGTISLTEGSTTLTGLGTAFTTELWPGATIYVDGGYKFKIAEVGSVTSATLTAESPVSLSGVDYYIDKSEANGFYTFDYIAKIRVVSKNGSNPPVVPGVNRDGLLDSNVKYLPSASEYGDYINYKYTKPAKAQDFVYALTNAFRDEVGAKPGFIFAPEAYASLVPDNVKITSEKEAREERLRVTEAIASVAEGRASGDNNVGIQHIGLIDCGGNISTLPEARDELVQIRSTVGSAFGHLSYYAPYVVNSVGNEIPLSGYVAGVACSRYVNEGFQQPPAGARYPLRDASGLTFNVSSQQQEVTYALGLNPARELPNRGIVIWGARTISSNSLFKFVNTRAILNVLIDVLSRSFDDLLFEQIDSPLSVYNRVYAVSASILNQFYRQGALFGNRPELAYSIVCDDTNNTLDSLEQGVVVCDVYVATSPTLEKLLISVARTPAGQISMINDSFARISEQITSYVEASSLVRR